MKNNSTWRECIIENIQREVYSYLSTKRRGRHGPSPLTSKWVE
jgi:hypothetical protein